MCEFFSFITYKGQKFYFDAEQRKGLPLNEQDSHSAIIKHFFPNATVDMDTQVNKWEFNPVTSVLTADSIVDQEEIFEDVLHWAKAFAGSSKFQLILDLMPAALEIALKDTDSGVREVAASNSNMTAELLELALKDSDYWVRRAAVSNPNMTVQLLEIALKDTDYWVREVAARHTNMTAELLELALKDSSYSVREAAVSNCNMTAALLEIALEDSSYSVRRVAVSNHSMTAELLEIALKDTDYVIRRVAELVLKEKFGRIALVSKG
jgi:HEAT repeat protein